MRQSLFIHDAEVKRKTYTHDSAGGYTHVFTTVDYIRCRLSRNGASERVRASRQEGDLEYTIYCAYDANVQREDILTIDLLDYEVITILNPSKRWSHVECKCRRLEDGA